MYSQDVFVFIGGDKISLPLEGCEILLLMFPMLGYDAAGLQRLYPNLLFLLNEEAYFLCSNEYDGYCMLW